MVVGLTVGSYPAVSKGVCKCRSCCGSWVYPFPLSFCLCCFRDNIRRTLWALDVEFFCGFWAFPCPLLSYLRCFGGERRDSSNTNQHIRKLRRTGRSFPTCMPSGALRRSSRARHRECPTGHERAPPCMTRNYSYRVLKNHSGSKELILPNA
jgi:hypothetical protein